MNLLTNGFGNNCARLFRPSKQFEPDIVECGAKLRACEGCKGTTECSPWYLHKFRATYTTTLLRNGVDARTVMAFTGHEDLATVLRYLAPAGDQPLQAKISKIAWV
jgi:integrase